MPVCRFYAGGPNSHFYTANTSECQWLRSLEAQNRSASAGKAFLDWGFETIAFWALVPENGQCAAGTTPVYRAYNHRAAKNDSNHRFMPDERIRAANDLVVDRRRHRVLLCVARGTALCPGAQIDGGCAVATGHVFDFKFHHHGNRSSSVWSTQRAPYYRGKVNALPPALHDHGFPHLPPKPVRQPLLTALKVWLCAFALNFAWEMLQAPFFVGMLEMPWWKATQRCLQASFGDAVMIVIAFAVVALVTREWRWMARPAVGRLAAFMLVAATQALALEWLMLRAAR